MIEICQDHQNEDVALLFWLGFSLMAHKSTFSAMRDQSIFSSLLTNTQSKREKERASKMEMK